MTTVARGWLNKSHKGSQARREKRWFVSDGFAVNYSKTEDPTIRTGRFDLRQVESIDEPELGELVITIKGKAHALHIYLSDAEPADAALFRRLWASGVDASAVRPALQPHRSVVLASRFRDKHGSQVTPSYSSSSSFSLSRGPSWYSSKTPRQGQPPPTSGGREWPSARASTHELGGGSEGDEEASLEEASLPAATAVPRPSGIPLINLSAISDAEAKKVSRDPLDAPARARHLFSTRFGGAQRAPVHPHTSRRSNACFMAHAPIHGHVTAVSGQLPICGLRTFGPCPPALLLSSLS